MYTIGIIGFGVVGRSMLAFLRSKYYQQDRCPAVYGVLLDEHDQLAGRMAVTVWDARPLTGDELSFIASHNATAVTSGDLAAFIQHSDVVITSPGVDLNAYQQYNDKFLCELDFFAHFFKKPVIAVTGSLGKTTITKLLGELVQSAAGHQAIIGGNVGIGMLDLVKQQDECDVAVLELSSFQLELNKKFAPDIAVWTNFYPNHLDRHGTLAQYLEAKYAMIRHQRADQVCIVTSDLLYGPMGDVVQERLRDHPATLYICVDSQQAFDLHNFTRTSYNLVYVENSHVVIAHVNNKIVQYVKPLIAVHLLPDITFIKNWLPIIATLHALHGDMAAIAVALRQRTTSLLDDHHDRIEHCGTFHQVDFYNDSKSTVIQATMVAVQSLAAHQRPIIVIVGGLSKGVDRSPLMQFLANNSMVKKVYCFGKDCDAFGGCTLLPTLEAVMADLAGRIQPGDQVLFSPSGTSFDFFKNYHERGNAFKNLVHKWTIGR